MGVGRARRHVLKHELAEGRHARVGVAGCRVAGDDAAPRGLDPPVGGEGELSLLRREHATARLESGTREYDGLPDGRPRDE